MHWSQRALLLQPFAELAHNCILGFLGSDIETQRIARFSLEAFCLAAKSWRGQTTWMHASERLIRRACVTLRGWQFIEVALGAGQVQGSKNVWA